MQLYYCYVCIDCIIFNLFKSSNIMKRKIDKLKENHQRLIESNKLTGMDSMISEQLKSIIDILYEIEFEISKNKIRSDHE